MNDAWKPFTPPGPFPKWPSWRYGPNGEAAIFDKEEDVPAGWADSPARARVVEDVVQILTSPATFEPAPAPRKPLTLKRREQTAE
jgi:hypothetical protein